MASKKPEPNFQTFKIGVKVGRPVKAAAKQFQVIKSLEEHVRILELGIASLKLSTKAITAKRDRVVGMLRQFIRDNNAPPFDFETGEIIEVDPNDDPAQMTIDEAGKGGDAEGDQDGDE